MSINIGPPAVEELRPRITVIGVGGAGGNAIANMIDAEIEGVDFIVANTDAQALNNSIAEHRIQLGPDITQGLGAGSRPEVGRAAAEETLDEIERALEGVHMCFIAAGMGGGTGTGAAPVIAKAARDKGVLTVGVVTKPFLFEGTRRMRAAEAGIEELQKHVDTLIVIPNQNLFLVAKAETTFKEAFQLADEVLQQGVRSITDLMVMPGLINLDFADVRSVMGEMGKAMMGTGEGEGENRALEAAERAIANPLLDGVSMQGAKGVIISIIGGDDMKLLEVDEAANHIRELVDPNANIIWGSAFNPDLAGQDPRLGGRHRDRAERRAWPQKPRARSASPLSRGPVARRPCGARRPRGRREPVSEPRARAGSRARARRRQPRRPRSGASRATGLATPPRTSELAEPATKAASTGEPTKAIADERRDRSGVAGEAERRRCARLRSSSTRAAPKSEAARTAGRCERAAMPRSSDCRAPAGGQDDGLLDADRLGRGGRAGLAAWCARRARLRRRRRKPAAAAAAAAPAARCSSAWPTSRAAAAVGADEDEDEDEDDGGASLSIPRFLGRQNNQ